MSNRIITSDIASGRKLPLTKGRLDFIQDNSEQLASSIAEGVLGSYTTGDVIIWKGCVFTGTDPGARTMTAGVIYYNGLFYQVPSASFTTTGSNIPLWTKVTIKADFATFSDGFQADVEQAQTFALVAGPAGGSGITGYIADYNGATVKKLKGDWVNTVFSSTWGNSLAYYRRSISGNIELDGIILANGTPPSTAVAGTIPIGFRPLTAKTYPVAAKINGVWNIYLLNILTDGTINIRNGDFTTPLTFGGTDTIFLSGIKFSQDV